MSEYVVKTFTERSDKLDENWRIVGEGWAEFALNDTIANVYFEQLYEAFPDYQFMLYDGDTVVATCNSIPVIWDLNPDHLFDAGWDWALESGFHNQQLGYAPTTLAALSITVAQEYLGQGVSAQAVRAMTAIAAEHDLNALIAPVRPSLKHRYPLIPMANYIRWTQPDGLPFDPWLRTHARLGAALVKVAPHSMVIPGTVAQWEEWTGMKFPESGDYIVPGALNPAYAMIEADLISYVEPNVWMHHPIPR